MTPMRTSARRRPLNGESAIRTTAKTLTFTGGANLGAVGAVPLFTVTGTVLIHIISAKATVNLTSAGGGSISLGTISQVAQFVAATVATAIDTSELWTSTSPTLGAVDTPDAMNNVQVLENIIGTVTVGAVDGGAMEVVVLWEPVSPGASLVAA